MYLQCVKNFFTTIILICTQLYETKKPYGLRNQEIWRLECELGVVKDSECPVDGGWSTWTAWSNCQGSCNDVGYHRRTRECNNPLTSRDGTPCVGPDEQIESCYIMNCSLQDFEKLVEGDISRTEALNQLKAVPALLEKCLQMECPFEAIEAALSYDNTWQLSSEGLWNALQCVKHNLGCPVKGEWGVWQSWSACNARCGKGLRWRLRRCDTPPPSSAILVCSGSPLQSKSCEGDQCAVEVPNLEYIARGSWSEWSQWSSCSEICGSGVRRRRRTCLESRIRFSSFSWGTHCRGQHDQLKVCIIHHCSIDGGWSGWGPWSPCSQSCGAGRRSRTRSCSKPIPSGDGKNCDGPRIETGSCYLDPCEVYTHTVAIFNGDSYLQYNLSGKKSALFHFFIRFRPLSPSGTLVRRGSLQSPYIRLSLQKWHICLDASGMSQYCGLSRICSSVAMEPAVWHTVLIAVSSESATIRFDDALTSIKSSFPCDPQLENSPINIYIGERFNGEIQEMTVNFKPLKFTIERDIRKTFSDYAPISSNVVYQKANIEEAYLIMENDHFMRLPCFRKQDDWRFELTIKPKGDSGLILFLSDDTINTWLYMALQNMRLKIKINIGEFKTECCSTHEYPPNQWLDVTISRHEGTNSIESIINSDEKLHLLFTKNGTSRWRKTFTQINQQCEKKKNMKSKSMSICRDEFFVGDVPTNVKEKIVEDFAPFSGVIASLIINGLLLDLHNSNLERDKENRTQLSSRTASVSHSYHETGWGPSNSLNLTCLHNRFTPNRISAHWFVLDTSVSEVLTDKNIKVSDNGKMLKLIVNMDTHVRGFYTCREHSLQHTYNVMTYGVLGELKYDLNSPDLTTIIAVITTASLVLLTLSWLIWEGISDLRNGYGFFRDAHFSQQEEAEAVCRYIDQNTNFFTSMSAVKLAKAKVRRRGKQLASKISFEAKEPQGLLQIKNAISEDSNQSSSSYLNTLPALSEQKTSNVNVSYDVFKCELPNSSPVENSSIRSPGPAWNSSLEMSPRMLCSRLTLAKYNHSPKHNIRLRKDNLTSRGGSDQGNKPLKFKMKDLNVINLSPAQKVLQKFYELKRDDL